MNPIALTIPGGGPGRLARAWLWLGLLALIGSGLLAILLVLSRTRVCRMYFRCATSSVPR